MRTRASLAALFAAAIITMTGCSSQGDSKQTEHDPSAVASPSHTTPTDTPTVTPTPSETTEEYTANFAKEFAVLGYVQIGTTNQWKPSSTSYGPVLTTDSKNVTAFTTDGITCEVTLDGVQATPGRVIMMATVAQMNGGLKPGQATYRVGDVQAGTYDCRKS
jgi:hypothetical protein